MKKTHIEELIEPKLTNPILIEGLPGMGMVGKITTQHLIKQLAAKRIAFLYSPHFPYYVLVNKKGTVRLLRGEFFCWRNQPEKNDLIFLTGDGQAQTIEGQYAVARCILDFAEKHAVKQIVTIGGYRNKVEKEPSVIAVSNNQRLLNAGLRAEAITSSNGNPIVGTAGLLLGLAKFRKIDAIGLLGENAGYLPDPLAAKSVAKVLLKMLHITVDLRELDEEIEKSKGLLKRMQELEERREEYAQRMSRVDYEKTTYIS